MLTHRRPPVNKEVIAAQNLLTLRARHPRLSRGITFGAGEAAAVMATFDQLCAGYAAFSDITVDGVRDSAQYNLPDPFNLEQIEVTNGAQRRLFRRGL